MSHYIDQTTGKPAIAYAGETPWHGLGQNLSPDAPLKVWQKEAGLDWEVKKQQALFQVDGDQFEIPNKFALYRTDTNAPLGVVSDKSFKEVQPGQMIEFYRDLISDYGYKMETAGSLKGGQRIWALANMGKNFRAGKGDEIGSYLLFATGMDGNTATVVKLTSVRVVCWNTLSMAIPTAYNKQTKTDLKAGTIAISHRSIFNPESVKQQLGLLPAQQKEFAGIVQALAGHKMTEKRTKEFFIELLVGDGADEEEVDSVEKRLGELMLAYTQGPGSNLATAKGTAWGAVNAVTFLTDHMVGRARDTALNKAWFGKNDALKTQALRLAMESAKLIAA